MHTSLEIQNANRIERNRVDADCRDRAQDAQLALNDMLWAIDKLRAAKAPDRNIENILTEVYAAVGYIRYEINRQLDDVGIEPDASIDLTELNALLEKVRKP